MSGRTLAGYQRKKAKGTLRDRTVRAKLTQARRNAAESLDEELERQMHRPHKATELIEEAARQIGERYTSRLQDIAWELAEEMARWRSERNACGLL